MAVNPFRTLPIYNPETAAKYFKMSRGDQPPHLFALADAAFHAMVQGHQAQVIFLLHCFSHPLGVCHQWRKRCRQDGVCQAILGSCYRCFRWPSRCAFTYSHRRAYHQGILLPAVPPFFLINRSKMTNCVCLVCFQMTSSLFLVHL